MNKLMHERIKSFETQLVKIRRDIHQHPEAGFNEHRTAQIVADFLEELKMDVHRGMAKTGVVGTLEGKQPGSRVVGFRADMDALSIQETSGLAHASIHDGIMHACGHDGHTAMLLGAARYLAENRDFCGTIRFIFQPAEESFGGGRVMVEEGLFDRFPCDVIYGMHGIPGIKTGEFAIRPGPFMASGDTWTIVFKGAGGHGAMPHKATDPFMPAAQFMTALQTIVAKNISAEESAVLSVGHIDGGRFDAPNIIPASVLLKGTARCYTPDIRDLLEQRITQIAQAQAAAFGCEVHVDYLRRYPPLINSSSPTRTAIRAAIKIAGKEGVDTHAPKVTGSEDFSFMLEKVPGAYIMIGCGDGPYVHTPGYDFNDETILPGIAFWVTLASLELSTGQEK